MRTTLAQRLPNYMVPTEIRVVPALPTNANGKIDRAALATTPVVAAPESADESPGLRMVREVFAAVLDVPTVGPDDDLYALGGASLGAAHIAAGLSARLGVDVPVRTVLAHPGVRDLAEIIPDLTTVSDAPEPGEAMPSTEQEYLRSLETVLGHPAPAVTQLVDLHHDVTTAALADAVELLVARHDALRPLTGSDTSGWQPCVAVDTDELADEPVLDEHPGLQVLTLPGQVLIRLARNRGDGQSVQILADELRALLSGARLPEPAPRYRDYANWRRSRWTSRLPALADYWTSALGPVVGADPFAARRPARRGFRNHAVRQRLPADLRMGLARRSLAPSAPYLAALGRLLAELSGRSVVAVGIPVAHREHPGLRDVIGRATDLLPVVVPADAGPDTAHDGLLRGLREADLPLPMIARLVDPVSPGVRPPVCQVAVIMHESGLPEDEIGPHWSDLDLVLHAYQTELVLSGDIDLFDVAALHGHLREITHHLTGWATPGSEETT